MSLTWVIFMVTVNRSYVIDAEVDGVYGKRIYLSFKEYFHSAVMNVKVVHKYVEICEESQTVREKEDTLFSKDFSLQNLVHLKEESTGQPFSRDSLVFSGNLMRFIARGDIHGRSEEEAVHFLFYQFFLEYYFENADHPLKEVLPNFMSKVANRNKLEEEHGWKEIVGMDNK